MQLPRGTMKALRDTYANLPQDKDLHRAGYQTASLRAKLYEQHNPGPNPQLARTK